MKTQWKIVMGSLVVVNAMGAVFGSLALRRQTATAAEDWYSFSLTDAINPSGAYDDGSISFTDPMTGGTPGDAHSGSAHPTKLIIVDNACVTGFDGSGNPIIDTTTANRCPGIGLGVNSPSACANAGVTDVGCCGGGSTSAYGAGPVTPLNLHRMSTTGNGGLFQRTLIVHDRQERDHLRLTAWYGVSSGAVDIGKGKKALIGYGSTDVEDEQISESPSVNVSTGLPACYLMLRKDNGHYAYILPSQVTTTHGTGMNGAVSTGIYRMASVYGNKAYYAENERAPMLDLSPTASDVPASSLGALWATNGSSRGQ